ncbi:hypothetical protein CMEL01_14178 [Colletotrichum melonis]|uniref:Uncharacterized protein n=1 Tax=Colletotrichum melonis TaxID=1209925 RepID=A0AAI9UUB3_9PEZI|nr:hypothetical protein CMEL01_14178 [Colletotrichum melonis]
MTGERNGQTSKVGARKANITPMPTILNKFLTTTDKVTTAAADSSHHYSSAPPYPSQLCALEWATSGPPSMQEKSVTSIAMCSGLGSALVELLFSSGFMLAEKHATRTDCRTTGAKLSTPDEVFGLAGGKD